MNTSKVREMLSKYPVYLTNVSSALISTYDFCYVDPNKYPHITEDNINKMLNFKPKSSDKGFNLTNCPGKFLRDNLELKLSPDLDNCNYVILKYNPLRSFLDDIKKGGTTFYAYNIEKLNLDIFKIVYDKLKNNSNIIIDDFCYIDIDSVNKITPDSTVTLVNTNSSMDNDIILLSNYDCAYYCYLFNECIKEGINIYFEDYNKDLYYKEINENEIDFSLMYNMINEMCVKEVLDSDDSAKNNIEKLYMNLFQYNNENLNKFISNSRDSIKLIDLKINIFNKNKYINYVNSIICPNNNLYTSYIDSICN